MTKKGYLICCILLFAATYLEAQTSLSSIFGDHMVLQRNSEVAIWGKDKPGKKVKVSADWGEQADAITDADGKWSLKIKTIKAGGPYSLEIKGSQKLEIKDVLLGEVWICSGQSNMEMPLRGFKGQPIYGNNEAISNSHNDQLRLFTLGRNISSSPVDTCVGQWSHSAPEVAADFSAVAYFYGRKLQANLNVPIGLISTSWGGTPAQAWTPKETILEGFKEFEKELLDTASYYQRSPTVLYNGMIHPIVPFTIKGVIWYQGEANKKNAEQYSRLFPAMIKSWRSIWGQGDFPFYFVQISTLDWGGEDWVTLREAQLETMLTTPNTGMAVTLDIGQEDCIHPPRKKEVGDRLAYWALAKTYGFKGVQCSGPVYKSMEIKESKAYLHFDFAPDGVCNMGQELKDFEIAGADKVYYPAEAIIKKGQLIVWSDEVKIPVNVRYAWKSYVEASLFNTAGLPASSFRTEKF